MTKVKFNETLLAYTAIEAQLKALEAKKKELREAIIKEMDGRTAVSTDRFVATYVESVRNIIDSAKVKADGLFEKYRKESVAHTLSVVEKGERDS